MQAEPETDHTNDNFEPTVPFDLSADESGTLVSEAQKYCAIEKREILVSCK